MLEIGTATYLIVCPLCFLAGFVDAIAGGGGLISLPAYLIAGLPPHYAIGTNKLSSGMGTALATLQYIRRGYVPWRLGFFCMVCALIASAMGAFFNLMINEEVFKVLLLVILPLTAAYVLKTKSLDLQPAPYSQAKTLCYALIGTFVIGAYDGFYGPGTGTFLLLVLTGFAHLTLNQANGIAKVVNLSTNVAALLVMLLNGKVFLLLGLCAGLFSIAGNYLGVRCFTQGGSKIARPIIIVVLLIFFAKLSYELLS